MHHYYDLTCPFCYLSLPLNRSLLLRTSSTTPLIELPFQAHPEIPPTGIHIGPRSGPMYDSIARRAKAANLPLKWRDHLPNSRTALAAVEWTRQKKGEEKAGRLREALFKAHFAEGRDIGDREVVAAVVEKEAGVEREELRWAWDGEQGVGRGKGEAFEMVDRAEERGRRVGVRGTPAWESGGEVVSGLPDGEEGVRVLLKMEKREGRV